jgi:hypothetical protein
VDKATIHRSTPSVGWTWNNDPFEPVLCCLLFGLNGWRRSDRGCANGHTIRIQRAGFRIFIGIDSWRAGNFESAAVSAVESNSRFGNTQLEQPVSLEDYSVSNRGLRSGLVGTPEQVADRIRAFEEAGVDLLLLQFSPQYEEMERFAEEVLPYFRPSANLDVHHRYPDMTIL